ncbi:MAG TPA: hypothetical protein VGE45_22230 [Chloroflexia bacterium]
MQRRETQRCPEAVKGDRRHAAQVPLVVARKHGPVVTLVSGRFYFPAGRIFST